MKCRFASASSALILLASHMAHAWDFTPLELLDPPVNGTEQSENPYALKGIHHFGMRTACKMVEHGDTIALMDEINAIETPHIEWANNYAEEPLRVLWVVYSKNSIRDPIEMRQRSNFDISLLQIFTTLEVFHDDEALNAMFAKRYDALLDQDYDVIVIRGYSPRVWRSKELHPLLASVYERIEAKVRNGTGLICLLSNQRWYQMHKDDLAVFHAMSPLSHGHQPARFPPERSEAASPVSEGLSFAGWPSCLVGSGGANKDAAVLARAGGRPMIATSSYGKGRVVGIEYVTFENNTGLIPDFEHEVTPLIGDYYEPVYALWLRALAWAGGKAPRVGIQAAEVTTCGAGARPEVAITLTRGEGVPGAVSLSYRLTDAYGDRLFAGDLTVPLAAEPVSVTPELPVLRANGLYRLDLWAKADGKTWNWGTASICVKDGAVFTLETPAEVVRPGEPAPFKVRCAVAGDLHVLGVDGLDRVFFDRRFPVSTVTTVRVDTALSALPENRIFFTLHVAADDAVLARRAAKLYLPRIGLNAANDQFIIASYGQTPTTPHLWPYSGLLYRAAGLNANYFNWHQRYRLEWSAGAGLYGITGAAWGFRQKGFGKVHHMSPNVPDVRAKWSKKLAEDIKDIQAFGSISRVLDDETWFAYTAYDKGEMRGAQLTQDKWTLDLFRAAMKEKYGEIAALNDMWGAEFATFDDVRVIEEDEIKGKDNPSGWIEFREYMNWTYAAGYYGWVSKQHEAALGDDYRAGCGAPHWKTSEGGPTYRGGDMNKMKGNMGFMMLYGGGSPGFAFAGQPGGQKYDPPENWKDYGAWSHLLSGADALWYYIAYAVIGPELAFRRHALWMGEGIDDIIKGCGQLVSGAKPLGADIRTLSTSENQHMGWLYAKRPDAWSELRLTGGQPESARTFGSLMQNLYVRSGGTTEEAIADGGLKGCKLLFLPQQLNLSDAAVEAIREYVRNGGTVMADILPATRHQIGKPRGNSALADVFGVDFSKATLQKESESWYSVGVESPKGAEHPLSKELIWLPNQVYCLGVEPTTAVAHAKILSKEGKEAAGCFVNEYGKGRALLLNFVYRELNDDTIGWHRMFGEALTAWVGVETDARILDPATHEPMAYRSLRAFTRGKATLLGCIRGRMMHSGGGVVMIDPSRAFSLSDEAMFTWTGNKHIYNVRSREYLGFDDSATIDLPSYQGRLLCLLPYRVTGLELTAPAAAEPGTSITVRAVVQTDGEAPGEHVFYFDVVSPTGARRPLYCATRVAPDGHAALRIPFALNDPAGEWTVTAHDVMTGVMTTSQIVLASEN